MMKWYERLKALLWPHTLVPFAVIVAIDYVNLVGHIVQILLGAYVAMQLLSFGLGAVGGIMARFNTKTPWREVLSTNLATALPLVGAGFQFSDWLFAERPGLETTVAPAASESHCQHGVPYEHETEYCSICMKEALRGEEHS